MSLRHTAFALAFQGIAITGADRWAARFVRGRGAILTLHRVCAPSGGTFAPNRLLEVTPRFLDESLAHIRANGIDLVSMDEAIQRIHAPNDGRFFVALTFDDGFRDTLEIALPILRKYQAPAMVYVVPGFAERTAPLWWVDLEEAIRLLEVVELTLDGEHHRWPSSTEREKCAAFDAVYWRLRAKPEAELRAIIADLSRVAGHDSRAMVEKLCLDWEGIKELARDPLITIGAHTLTHPRLAKVGADQAQAEISGSKSAIEANLSIDVRHFAYPVGDPTSAGQREFDMIAKAGLASAVTTRPGHVFSEHSAHIYALPRVSLNGLHQNRAALRALLSGLPFWALNRGRKLNVS